MTAKGRFTLDTNILIYAVDRDAGERHERARAIVGQAARRDCVLTLQALAEFFHATTRKGLLGADRASAYVRDWLEVFPVAAADDATLSDAMDAVAEHRLSFWDAMLWACARRGGCAAVLSEDFQDGRRLSGVTFVDPFAADADVRLAALFAE